VWPRLSHLCPLDHPHRLTAWRRYRQHPHLTVLYLAIHLPSIPHIQHQALAVQLQVHRQSGLQIHNIESLVGPVVVSIHPMKMQRRTRQRRWLRYECLLVSLLPLLVCLLSGCKSSLSLPVVAHGNGHSGPKSELLELIEQQKPLSQPPPTAPDPDLSRWLSSTDLASALRLSRVGPLHVPVFMNVLVIGMDGHGNGGVNLPQEQLAEWMQHLDHIAPYAQMTADEAIQARGREGSAWGDEANGEAQHQWQQASSSTRKRQRASSIADDGSAEQSAAAELRYRYHLRLINLSPKVLEVVERYLSVHYRVESKGEHTAFQVDATIMDGLLNALVKHLQIDDAYNLFVLNPSRKWLVVPSSVPADAAIRYGYRSGFSNDELDDVLDGSDTNVAKLTRDFLESDGAKYPMQEDGEEVPIPEFTPKHSDKEQPRLQVQDHVEASASWADRILAAPHFTGPQPLTSYISQQSTYHPQVLRASVGNTYAYEDCLVDNWVGRGRSLFVDLSAGPFQWGPVVGGAGVRTNTSFPSIETFVSLREKEKAEKVVEDDYVDASYDAEAVEAEKILLEGLLRSRRCGDAAAAAISSDAECRNLASKLDDLHTFEREHAHQLVSENDSILTPRKKAPAMDSMEGLSFFHDDTIESGGINTGHDASIETDHFLAHLSSTLALAMQQVITPTVAQTQTTQTPSPKPTVAGSSRLLSIPPLSSSAGYAQQVHFQLYILTNHGNYDPLDGGKLFARLKYGLEQLRLNSLQTFSYAIMQLSMDEDPALSMAYSNALRSAVVPTVLFDGKFAAIKRMYIDSATLASQLTSMDMEDKAKRDRVFGASNRKEAASSRLSFSNTRKREIPIFLFSLDFPLPVLVDKYYQSRALTDANMVVAVQSNLHLWESPLSCNRKPVYWNLRDPIRSILSSTAQLLGGLLPMHVHQRRTVTPDASGSGSEGRGSVTQQWLWSVGTSPLALTNAQGFEWSQVQKDTLHRNYVFMAIKDATQHVNAHIALLTKQKTSVANSVLAGLGDVPLTDADRLKLNQTMAALQINPSDSNLASINGRYSARTWELQQSYANFLDTIQRDLLAPLEELHFDYACANIDKLYEKATHFSSLVQSLVTWNMRDHCLTSTSTAAPITPSRRSSRSPFTLSYHWYLLAACSCIAIILYRLLVQKTDKPKLN